MSEALRCLTPPTAANSPPPSATPSPNCSASPRSPTSWAAGSPRPVTSCTWSAVRCATPCSAGSATTSTSAPTPTPTQTLRDLKGWAEAIWETGREFGTIGAQRDGLRLEITTFRAEAYDRVSRNPVVRYGTSLVDDLRRRDFTINAMAVSLPEHRVHRPVRRAGRPRRAGDPHPGHAARSRSATTRCGCCGPPGSPPSCGSPSHPDVRAGDDRDGRRPGPDHRRADPRRVHQAALRRRPDHRAAAAGRHRAGRPVPAGADRPASWRSTSTPSTRTSTSTR